MALPWTFRGGAAILSSAHHHLHLLSVSFFFVAVDVLPHAHREGVAMGLFRGTGATMLREPLQFAIYYPVVSEGGSEYRS